MPHGVTTIPPSQVITAPTVNAPAREARKIANPAMSCGVPTRPRGIVRAQGVPVGALHVAAGAHARAEHPRRERARRDRIEQDVALDEPTRQLARQRVDRRLGHPVRHGVERRAADPVDRSDVDHPRRLVGGGSGLEQWQEPLREEEDTLDVGVHHLVPADLGELVDARSPRHPGVVDEHVEARFTTGEFAREQVDAVEFGEVGGDGNAFAAVGLRQARGRRIADIRLPRADVDLGTVGQEPGGDHLPDARVTHRSRARPCPARRTARRWSGCQWSGSARSYPSVARRWPIA